MATNYETDPLTAKNVLSGLSEKWLASKAQLFAETRMHPSKARGLLERLEREGPEPVFEEMCDEMPGLFNGNSTTNRRLRAYAANRQKLREETTGA